MQLIFSLSKIKQKNKKANNCKNEGDRNKMPNHFFPTREKKWYNCKQ